MTPKISRRQTLRAFGTVSLGALLAACGVGRDNADDAVTTAQVPTSTGSTTTVRPQISPTTATSQLFEGAASCTLTAEQTQGPYYFDVDMIRSDIREDRAGVPLHLAVRVQDADTCEPISNAVVDVWHCDAVGVYSGFEAASRSAGGGPPGGPPVGGDGRPGATVTDDETFLRGAQVTNPDGVVEFTTVYPGWYTGRTVHIHAKVHLDSATLVTTQFYFDEAISEQVYAQAPYNQHAGRDTFNDTDGIINSGGQPPMLTLSQEGEGWLGVITVGVTRS